MLIRRQLVLGAAALGVSAPTLAPSSHNTQCWQFRVQAALAHGLQFNASFDPAGAGTVAPSLEATKARASPLFQAIAALQCTRGDYDGTSLSPEELRWLEQAGSGQGVRVLRLTERPAMEKVLEYVVAGNTALAG